MYKSKSLVVYLLSFLPINRLFPERHFFTTLEISLSLINFFRLKQKWIFATDPKINNRFITILTDDFLRGRQPRLNVTLI